MEFLSSLIWPTVALCCAYLASRTLSSRRAERKRYKSLCRKLAALAIRVSEYPAPETLLELGPGRVDTRLKELEAGLPKLVENVNKMVADLHEMQGIVRSMKNAKATANLFAVGSD